MSRLIFEKTPAAEIKEMTRRLRGVKGDKWLDDFLARARTRRAAGLEAGDTPPGTDPDSEAWQLCELHAAFDDLSQTEKDLMMKFAPGCKPRRPPVKTT